MRPEADAAPLPPTFAEAFWVWLRVAALSFGGPAGQIAVMHRIVVEEKRWVSEGRFLHALNYCMLLPGPEAQQLATYIGWLFHRTAGGLMAGLLFVLPGFLSILALSLVYAEYQDVAVVRGMFDGLKPAVLAVVAAAVLRIGRRSLKTRAMVSIAVAAFAAIFFFEVPFPLIVLASAIAGAIGGRVAPHSFVVIKGHAAPGDADPDSDRFAPTPNPPRPTLARSAAVLGVWLTVWLAPIGVIVAATGAESVYSRQALFFSKAAVVTFGGAYAVLAYVAQECVETHHWLAPAEMLDGLGMAETTPGPLIQVVQFVGFLGAYRNPGALDPVVAGVLGSLVVTWVTFAPCFLWIFLGAPYIEHLRGRAVLNAALSAVTAAVVGAVLSLAIWLALHTVFGVVGECRGLGGRLLAPEWGSVDWLALGIATAAGVAVFRYKAGIVAPLAGGAAVGVLAAVFPGG